MNNFNKFLTNSEDLKIVFESKTSPTRIYFIILLFLLAFFVLFPAIKLGLDVFILWIVFVLILIFSLANALSEQKSTYLLTTTRLIHIIRSYKDNYRIKGYIKLSQIEAVYKQGKTILIISNNHKYYLKGIKLADKLYNNMDSYIKRQNLV